VTRHFGHLAIAFFIIAASSLAALSQTSGGANTEAPSAAQASAPEAQNRTSANETFELNITERRITERDFAASTTVEVGEETARGLLLRVGVAVGADEINVLLRNVRGRVSFRATLERVLERLNARRAPGATR
jgi:outer membrane receptor protein involved in Fe transport